jgi:hypothetical protein
VLLSGRWATVQLHINNLTSLILLSHIVSFPSRQDRIQRLLFRNTRARTGSAHSRRPPSPTDQCLSVTSPLPSQSVQSTLYHCCYQPIETRWQPRPTASYAPVPALPDPASVSIVSSPHRMLQQSWRAWLGRLVEVWLWGSY